MGGGSDRALQLAGCCPKIWQIGLEQMFATVRVGEGRDVQRGDDRAASISDGHRQRSQTRSAFLLDQRPLLSGAAFQSIFQPRRIGDSPARTRIGLTPSTPDSALTKRQ